MLDIGGKIGFTSGVEVVSGDSDGTLALATLFGTKLGIESEPNMPGGNGGRFEGNDEGGKEVEVKLSERVEVGPEEGYSGKFEGPAGKEALNPEYCIGCCCNDGGIGRPGGGRSKDCC